MRRTVVFVLFSLLATAIAVAAPKYTITDLGTFGGDFSQALALNSKGQVTGVATLPNGDEHAFLYTNGKLKDLGTLGGSSSAGTAINEAGQVTGVAQVGGSEAAVCRFVISPNSGCHAFLYSDGFMSDLGRSVAITAMAAPSTTSDRLPERLL